MTLAYKLSLFAILDLFFRVFLNKKDKVVNTRITKKAPQKKKIDVNELPKCRVELPKLSERYINFRLQGKKVSINDTVEFADTGDSSNSNSSKSSSNSRSTPRSSRGRTTTRYSSRSRSRHHHRRYSPSSSSSITSNSSSSPSPVRSRSRSRYSHRHEHRHHAHRGQKYRREHRRREHRRHGHRRHVHHCRNRSYSPSSTDEDYRDHENSVSAEDTAKAPAKRRARSQSIAGKYFYLVCFFL